MNFIGTYEEILHSVHNILLVMLAVQAVSLAVLMAGTGYVLERRLNLE